MYILSGPFPGSRHVSTRFRNKILLTFLLPDLYFFRGQGSPCPPGGENLSSLRAVGMDAPARGRESPGGPSLVRRGSLTPEINTRPSGAGATRGRPWVWSVLPLPRQTSIHLHTAAFLGQIPCDA